MQITILGKRWELKFLDGRKMPDALGACEPPDSPRKEIRVRKNLQGVEMLDTLIHEMLHSADWTKDEHDWIQPVAEDIARTLWKLGYRRKGHDGIP